jgi:hypothetical protein
MNCMHYNRYKNTEAKLNNETYCNFVIHGY